MWAILSVDCYEKSGQFVEWKFPSKVIVSMILFSFCRFEMMLTACSKVVNLEIRDSCNEI